eukprot:scaffold67832_cov49-Attheya_sp.AAC.1
MFSFSNILWQIVCEVTNTGNENAKITDKTPFAKRIKKEFLKGPWGEEFITKYEDPLNFKNLWWGTTNYIVLGTASMTALKYTQNAMAKRTVDTAERFIENNLGDDGSNTEIMEHLMSVNGAGRGKDYNEAVKKVQKELEGNLLQDEISLARMAFIYLQIMNNIRVITDPEDQDNTMKRNKGAQENGRRLFEDHKVRLLPSCREF